MKCKQCGAELDADSVFCPECGAKTTPEEAAGQWEQGNQEDGQQPMIFCPECGQSMTADSIFCPNCGHSMGQGSDPGKKNIKKLILPAAAVVAAVIVIAAGVKIGGALLGGSGSNSRKVYNKEKILYIKDESLLQANTKKLKKDPFEYTDEFNGDHITGSRNASWTRLTKDGKYCFYPERFDSDGAFRLMRRKAGSKKEGEKIDSDVTRYTLLDDGTVLYMKNNNTLYFWNGKEKTKLDSDVENYNLPNEQNLVVWSVSDGSDESDLYFQKLGKKGEKSKLESSIQTFWGGNDDFSKVYIKKNDAVYYIEKMGEKTKLVGDIETIRGLDTDKGTFYFTVKEEDEDYSFRHDLYYFNGKEKEKIFEDFIDFAYSADGTVIFTHMDRDSYEDEYYLAVGKEVISLDSEVLSDFAVNEDKKMIYALDGEGSDGCDLISINYGKSGDVKKLDEDVQDIEDVYNGTLYYFKDLDRDEYSGDLYCNGKMVLSDVARGSITEVPDSDRIVCITDGNSGKHRGTLTMLKGDKDTKIADDVYRYDVRDEKNIVILTDYNMSRYRGDLKVFQGKESKLVDSDVAGFAGFGNTRFCP